MVHFGVQGETIAVKAFNQVHFPQVVFENPAGENADGKSVYQFAFTARCRQSAVTEVIIQINFVSLNPFGHQGQQAGTGQTVIGKAVQTPRSFAATERSGQRLVEWFRPLAQ